MQTIVRVPKRVCALAALVITLVAASAGAVDPPPSVLPDFPLTQLDGTTVSSKQLPLQPKWLMIFTMANCTGCDKLLALISAADSPNVPVQVVIVVSGASPDQVQKMIAGFPDLAASAWYADPQKQAAEQMKLTGMPAVLGMQQDTVEWTILGTLSGDSAKMKSVLSSWCNTNQPMGP